MYFVQDTKSEVKFKDEKLLRSLTSTGNDCKYFCATPKSRDENLPGSS